MAEKSRASQTLGLEATYLGLKAAEVYLQRGKLAITRLSYFKFSPAHSQQFQEPLALDLTGRQLIVTALDGNETLVRPLDIKLQKEKDIDAVLHFQAEPLIPYPIESALLDKQALSTSNDGTLLTLLAVKKEHLQRHLDVFKKWHIEPEVVSSVPLALGAFSRFALPAETPAHFVLHFGEDQTCCVFVKEGKLIASKASPYSLRSIKQAYQEDSQLKDDELETHFSNLDWKTINATQLPSTYKKIKEISIEIGKVLFSLMKQVKELQQPPLLATGEGGANSSLAQLILSEFKGEMLNLTPHLAPPFSAAELKIFALPIGEALTGLPKGFDHINFLQGEFTFPHPWRRLKKPLLYYYALCLLLAFSFYAYSQAHLKSKENELQSKYALLLTSLNKTPEFIEEKIKEQGLPSKLEDPSAASPHQFLTALTADEINDRVAILENELRAIPDLFPLEPSLPKVSDLLAWLSTHPNIVGKEGQKPLITIEGLSYTMVKRPEMTKKAEKYQVKVELDFSSANPTAARELHDALLAPNLFIDPKSEVKWSNQKGRYKAIFMLKDRTSYS